MNNKAIFLDRDGVVNVDHGYLYQPEQFEFIDGVFEACRAFQDAGYLIIIITNQSGIARGYYTEQDFAKLTEWMNARFTEHGIHITDVYYCPHHPTKGLAEYQLACDCRKPEPGMLLKAIKTHHIDAGASLIVGDKVSDVQAGRNAGLGHCFLVESGQHFTVQQAAEADRVYSNLTELAADFLAKLD